MHGCLRNLQGLHVAVDSCHNLQGLNLVEIPVTEVENQVTLWQILSDIKQLTHLAVDLCVLSTRNKHILGRLYEKFTKLQALKSRTRI